jgi:hypothetical protein
VNENAPQRASTAARCAQGERADDALVVSRLEEAARLLELQGADPFRVRAYRRLTRVPGIGPRRTAAIRAGLATALGRQRRNVRRRVVERPSVELLLDVDAQYRTRAVRGELHRIAPRRFNPKGEAWLPIMHLEQDRWHFTALYSNTALAHELGRTDDWVVIYYYDGEHRESQCTVVTETLGAIRGLRVVRGRERECAALYRRRRERARSDPAQQEAGTERAQRSGELAQARE